MSYVEKAIGHKFDECLSEATPIKALLRVELDLQRFVFPVGGVRAAQLLPLAQRLRRLRVAVTASGARHADLHYVRDVHAGGRRGSGSGAGCPDGRVRPTVCAAAQHACRLARLTGRRGGCCAGWPVAAGQHHTTGSLPRCATIRATARSGSAAAERPARPARTPRVRRPSLPHRKGRD